MEDTIKLEAQQDFLEKIANAKPEIALAEIIWNSFDADASRVDVRFIGDEINVNEIQIEDNGSGIPFDKIKTYFSSLGGSWKVNSRKTATGRIIHGKNGQGRLKCFALGEYVEWHIHSQEKKYGVKAQYGTFKNFKIFDQPDPIDNTTGVLVKIIHPHKQWQIFSSDIAKAKLCPIFGYYLSMYPNITIAIQGDKINIEELIENRKDIEIASVQYGNENYKIDIQIIEWCSSANEREMYFCSAEGFPIAKIDKQIRGISDFSFVAYVKSNLFELDDVKNLLEIQEMDKELSKIVDTITRSVKLHFIERKISMSSSIIEKWKIDDVYPYANQPENEIEKANQQLFDIVAINIVDSVDKYTDISNESLKFQFSLLKEVLENNPSDVKRIVSEVLNLPQNKRDDLIELLDQTSLSSIISASKEISSRLHFLRGLEEIVFNTEEKKKTKERSQLHRVLADNTWIFGENFALTCDDESLHQVLKKYSSLVDQDVDFSHELKRIDGTRGIVDLFLSKRVPSNRAEDFEFLVVELKAPKVKIGEKEIAQIKKYAFAIIDDERFRSQGNTRWEFWIVSCDLDSYAKMELKNANTDRDTIFQTDGADGVFLKIKVKTWSSIIRDCEYRHKFIKEKLNISVNADCGLEFLKTKYDELFAKQMDETNQEYQEGA